MFVGILYYWIEYLKKAKEFNLKLSISFDLDIFTVQPNFVAKNIAFRLDSLIMSSFLRLLGMIEIFSI